MDIVLNIEPIIDFLTLPADVFLIRLFLMVGWIPIAWIILWGILQIWMMYINDQWGSKQKSILLAIDIPRNNMQSPKAMENLFTYFAGAHSTMNLIEEYWEGKFQLSFSFEIVSINGYTQFAIRTPVAFRNLVETAVYSQYPDAEVNEISDYTEGYPTKFPDDDYDIWGAEFVLVKDSAYPIKTYVDFEHKLGDPDTHFKDPMATLMDLCSSLKQGEQLWFQMIVKPIDHSWVKGADAEMNKILASNTSEFGMLSMKPKARMQVEAIQMKMNKLGFNSKIRVVYIAKKDVMNKPKVVNGFVGYIKQFISNDLNNLKPDTSNTGTSTAYFFKDSRLNKKKNSIMSNYKSRSGWSGNMMYVLNIEELATLWHFPVEGSVKAPLIQKAPGRKAEPPTSLPMGEEISVPSDIDSIFAEEDFLHEVIGDTHGSMPSSNSNQLSESNNISDVGKNIPPANLPFE